MRNRKEEEPMEKTYKLSPEELRPPETGVREWFEDLVALQREGIDRGITPQNIRCVAKNMEGEWRGRVWDYYLSTLSPEERQLIKRTTRPGPESHTHKGPYFDYGVPYDEIL